MALLDNDGKLQAQTIGILSTLAAELLQCPYGEKQKLPDGIVEIPSNVWNKDEREASISILKECNDRRQRARLPTFLNDACNNWYRELLGDDFIYVGIYEEIPRLTLRCAVGIDKTCAETWKQNIDCVATLITDI